MKRAISSVKANLLNLENEERWQDLVAEVNPQMLEQPGWLTKQYQIYALLNPRDQTIRYIGVSNDVKRRFYEHLQYVGIGQQERHWIEELGRLGLSPLVQILETIETTSNQRDVAYKRERY